MTGAQRQAGWRKRRREAEAARMRQQGQEPPHKPYQPPYGYQRAKQTLMAQGHEFVRAAREAGFEEGVFVDGAFVGAGEVIVLAGLSASERKQRLAERRRDTKWLACNLVEHYMAMLQVSPDELARHIDVNLREHHLQRVTALNRRSRPDRGR